MYCLLFSFFRSINPDEIPEKVHIQVCLEGEWKEEELSDLSKVEERSDDDECDDVNSGIRIINQVRHWITAYIDKVSLSSSKYLPVKS